MPKISNLIDARTPAGKAQLLEALQGREPVQRYSGAIRCERLTVTLPVPPSYNRYWRSSARGGYISQEGRVFKVKASRVLAALQAKPFQGSVGIRLRFYLARKNADMDNRIKQIQDCMQGHFYNDDKQVVEIHALRFDDPKNPRVEVEVWER